jgi:hypothetical protein
VHARPDVCPEARADHQHRAADAVDRRGVSVAFPLLESSILLPRSHSQLLQEHIPVVTDDGHLTAAGAIYRARQAGAAVVDFRNKDGLTAYVQLQAAPARLDGGPAVAVGGETDHHMEAVPAAPRLENLDALLPVSVATSANGRPTRADILEKWAELWANDNSIWDRVTSRASAELSNSAANNTPADQCIA